MHLYIFNVVLKCSHSWVIPAFRDFIVPRLSNVPRPQFCYYYSHPIIFLETQSYSVILRFRPSLVQPSPWTPYHSGCSESRSLRLTSAPLPPPASRLWGAALFTTFIGSGTLLCCFTPFWMSVPQCSYHSNSALRNDVFFQVSNNPFLLELILSIDWQPETAKKLLFSVLRTFWNSILLIIKYFLHWSVSRFLTICQYVRLCYIVHSHMSFACNKN